MRRPLLLLAALLAGLLVLIVALRRPRQPGPAAATATNAPGLPASGLVPGASRLPPDAPRLAPDASPSRLADELNASGGDIRRDLQIVHDILEAWQTNFPREGNPFGENTEITAALTGRNHLQLALIPPGHPAINARGELCDRWGTPFFFHQISGTQMEIRSAGPDRALFTADDIVRTP